MRGLLSKVIARLAGPKDGLQRRLLTGSGIALVARIGQTGLMFLVTIFLARVLGTEQYGLYAIIMSVIAFALLVSATGFNKVTVRDVSGSLAEGLTNEARQISRITFSLVLAVALVAGIAGAFVVSLLIPGDYGFDPWWMGSVFLLLLLFQSASSQLAASVNGLGHIAASSVPSQIGGPGLFLLGLIAVTFVFQEALSPTRVLLIHGFAMALVTVTTLGLLVRLAPAPSGPRQPTRAIVARTTKSALPLMASAGLVVVQFNTDILMLGAMVGAEASGIYKVATRAAELLAVGLAICGPVASPLISSAVRTQDRDRLLRVSYGTAAVAAAIGITLGVTLLSFGSLILSIFGSEFVAGRQALTILTLGQIAVVLFGPLHLLLIMGGHERAFSLGMLITAGANVLFNAVLIPVLGIEGAAVATALSTVGGTVVLWIMVRARFAFDPSVPMSIGPLIRLAGGSMAPPSVRSENIRKSP